MTDLLGGLKPWNTVREVAQHLGITEGRVYDGIARWRASLPDGLEAHRPGNGKEFRIAKASVARWVGVAPVVVPLRRTGS